MCSRANVAVTVCGSDMASSSPSMVSMGSPREVHGDLGADVLGEQVGHDGRDFTARDHVSGRQLDLDLIHDYLACR